MNNLKINKIENRKNLKNLKKKKEGGKSQGNTSERVN